MVSNALDPQDVSHLLDVFSKLQSQGIRTYALGYLEGLAYTVAEQGALQHVDQQPQSSDQPDQPTV